MEDIYFGFGQKPLAKYSQFSDFVLILCAPTLAWFASWLRWFGILLKITSETIRTVQSVCVEEQRCKNLLE